MCDKGENKFLTSKSIKREALIITREVTMMIQRSSFRNYCFFPSKSINKKQNKIVVTFTMWDVR